MEPVAKVTAVLMSAAGIFVTGLLAATLFGSFLAGAVAALMLATNGMWLQYSTYSMIETRILLCAALAVLFSFQKRPVWSGLFWFLTLVQKPQIFVFAAILWYTVELVQQLSKKGFKFAPVLKKYRAVMVGHAVAIVFGAAYYLWSATINTEADLPWVQWMGPRTHKWYFGSWQERLNLFYAKAQLLDWFKRSGLNVAVPLILICVKPQNIWPLLKGAMRVALPMLTALVAYTFIFYAVFIVHEYYAHPLNWGAAVMTGGVFAYVYDQLLKKSTHVRTWFKASPQVLTTVVLVAMALKLSIGALQGVSKYYQFAKSIDQTSTPFGVQVFPEKNSFVVMAVPESGRELMHLYYTKQRGYIWCGRNEKFAPRAFWKAKGVRFIAWARGIDPHTGFNRWEVRTIDEELAIARKHHWSSDLNDAWAGREMKDWAALGSARGYEPCFDEKYFDPRTWR